MPQSEGAHRPAEPPARSAEPPANRGGEQGHAAEAPRGGNEKPAHPERGNDKNDKPDGNEKPH
jgi:hypothetical protein